MQFSACRPNTSMRSAPLDFTSKLVRTSWMTPFATEFAVKRPENRAAFIAEVVAWLRGNERSSVLTTESAQELDGENAHLLAESGEELRLRELRVADKLEAIGFRHDLPDARGRLWRTEGVIRCGGGDLDQDIIRFRTQCLARTPGAYLESPRKPYLIKTLLKDGWGGADGPFSITDAPVWLKDDKPGLALVGEIVAGTANKWLPIIYISASDGEGWPLTQQELEKLAYDLGGVAHVVVEPNRRFSLRVRDAFGGKNVYGGTVGIYVPGQGLKRRLFFGMDIANPRDLAEATKESAIEIRGHMPSFGWDWSELQEHSLRAQRATYRGALPANEAEKLFDQYGVQLDELREENRQLRAQLTAASTDSVALDHTDGLAGLVQRIGPEIYPGELSDRLRLAALTTLELADARGLDSRSRAILGRITERLGRSPCLDTLISDIERATKDSKRVARELTSLLEHHGYNEKSDNRHVRLEPKDEFYGLSSITVSKTPSDIRSLKNIASQVKLTLGIGKLPA